MTIDILLSTYNGALFVDEQIESIMGQTCQDFKLLIRDDGSKDETPSKLLAWRQRYPDKIEIYLESNVGVIESFNRIYPHSTSPYLAFCDQDDIWHPEKLEKCLNLLQKNEKNTPLLVHSDLMVVDRDKRVLDRSFWHYSYLSGHPKYASFSRLLVQNVVTGCTTLFNRELAKVAFPTPNKSIMHDWWFALVASQFGRVIALNEPLILYRQHGNNTVGAKPFSIFSSPSYNLNRFLKWARHEKKKVEQAQVFQERYGAKLTQKRLDLLTDFIQMKEASYFERLKMIFKHKFYKIGWPRNLIYLFYVPKKRDL